MSLGHKDYLKDWSKDLLMDHPCEPGPQRLVQRPPNGSCPWITRVSLVHKDYLKDWSEDLLMDPVDGSTHEPGPQKLPQRLAQRPPNGSCPWATHVNLVNSPKVHPNFEMQILPAFIRCNS